MARGEVTATAGDRPPLGAPEAGGARRVRVLVAVLRFGLAALIVAAIVGQLLTSLGYWRSVGVQNVGVSVANFFSFFTIQSNAIAAITMVIGAVVLLRRHGPNPGWFAVLQLCATTYLATTGVVYNLLLRGLVRPEGSSLAWSNEVLHVVVPLYLVLDFLLGPGRRPLPWRTLWVVAAYPVVWIGYTLLRGPVTPDEVGRKLVWYPYPFLDPTPSGYGSVALYVVGIAAFIVGTGALLLWAGRREARRRVRVEQVVR